ncbi:hypothetical protein O181_001705 [Austropuccinia psidii MF-1]|uniref:Uncharacterized protein n=1 Tax=Austropuccinia psidii MF-1 TaxID=1389203 RepID=A0A9Q3BB21_9BASI|nr:hypothetical protein [Austropuccinia psidii MF-1]
MDLDQDIQVINTKDKNFSPEERHKWRLKELPPVPKGSRSRDIPVSVQDLVHGGKKARMETSSKPLDGDNELIYSIEGALRPIRDRGPSERLDSNFCQRESQTDKIPFGKPKNIIRGSEKVVGPKEGKKPCGSSSSLLKKQQKREREPQRTTRRESKRQRERPSPSGTSLTIRIKELQRKKKQPMTMCSI